MEKAKQKINADDPQSGMNPQIAIGILTNNQQAVPFKRTDIDLDIDVKYTSEKMIFADLQELVVINQSTGEFQPTSQALKGDGVILAMALGRREEERKQLEVFHLLQQKAQSWALEGQHGTGEGSDHESIQEYHFQRFKLYEKKWYPNWHPLSRKY